MDARKISILFIVVTLILYGENKIPAQSRVQLPGMKQAAADSVSADKNKTPVITYKLIPGVNNTWGYDIYMDGRVNIHQPSIPALPGNDGFKTQEKAEKAARLAIKKIKNGEMPPTITVEELKKLKAL
ncbi:MAG: DUF4907 domain-containing protein [Bacteroidales bacterium]|nr:DUF4907 domain-containing protein [Bacteroidales bacterium]